MMITEFFNTLPSWAVLLIKLGLSCLSGGLIGLERGRHGRSAGMRTHILVCLGATLASMLDVHINALIGSDGTRIAAQVVTGIGFLGAGVILVKRDLTVTGLTTAAGLWATSIIGLAYGFGHFEAALAATLLLLCTTMLLYRLEAGQKSVLCLYFEIDDLAATNAVMEKLKEMVPMGQMELIQPKSGNTAHIGIRLNFTKKRVRAWGHTGKHLEPFLAIEHVLYVVAE
ncbi:MAG: MgtC/SapB family protein [Clostridia bacterium]|nr:MgtC/SapB family protein [Clostridia bacterium]